MRLWVDQCLALLDELKIEKANVVGNSMGGAIALHLLMDAPHRFYRVVYMGPIGTPHQITPALDRLWGFYDDPSVQMFKTSFAGLSMTTHSSRTDSTRSRRRVLKPR
jgi:2-hydroxymuconate-semialdehyde hydrolase